MHDLSKPTERQQEVLAVIEGWIAQHGYPPTRAEIAAALGFRSANAAQEHLQALIRKGWLTADGTHRGIKLVKPGRPGSKSAAGKFPADKSLASEPIFRLPLIGRVAAGQPILAEAHIEARYVLDPALFSPRPDYLLRVAGLSMRDAGLLDGDLVAVRRTTEVRNGQIIVARLGDEATVKTFHRRGERIRLLPANPEFAPIEIDPREPLVIEGLVVGVLRRTPALQKVPKEIRAGAMGSDSSHR